MRFLDVHKHRSIFSDPVCSRVLLLAAVVLSSAGVYFNALSNGFVYDDLVQVVANPWIRDAGSLPEIFTSNAWAYKGQTANYYRPGMHILFLLTHKITGMNPFGFHLVNVLFHCLNSILVFLLLSRILYSRPLVDPSPSSWPPFLAALLFATHPIHTETVAWVSGIPDLSFTLFGLLSCLFHIGPARDGKATIRGTSILSGMMFFASLLCKETALVIPLILFAHDLAFGKEKAEFLPFVKRYAPHIALGFLYLGLRGNALQGMAPVKHHAELTTFQVILGAITLLPQYIGKLVLPIELKAFHVFHPPTGMWGPREISSFLFLLLLFCFLFVSFRKSRTAFAFAVMVLAPLLPVLYVPALGENPFAERYLYYPSIGFVGLLAMTFDRFRALRPGAWIPASVACGLVILAYSHATIDRNRIWKDEYTLWEDTVRKSPDGPIPNYNFALILHGRGDIDRAIEYYRRALQLKPNARVYTDLGLAYFSKGFIDVAVSLYRDAIRLDPRYPLAYNNLGVALEKIGLLEESIEAYIQAIRLNPMDADMYNNLGYSYLRLGKSQDAVRCFLTALRLDPNHERARHNLYLAGQ